MFVELGTKELCGMTIGGNPGCPEICDGNFAIRHARQLRCFDASNDAGQPSRSALRDCAGPGEVAEFDTRVPHWFGSTGDVPVEVLSILGRQGERMHVRAQPKDRADPEH